MCFQRGSKTEDDMAKVMSSHVLVASKPERTMVGLVLSLFATVDELSFPSTMLHPVMEDSAMDRISVGNLLLVRS